MSVVLETVPAEVAMTTVPPLTVRLLLLVSLSWTVMVEVDAPSAVIVVGSAAMSEVLGLAVPVPNVTVAVAPAGGPFTVKLMVAVLAEVAEVSVAV